jgi:ABC-type nitrate/sulfonate/bicarbonate transport system substrate-binding protein
MRLHYLGARISLIASVLSGFVLFRSSIAAETPLLQATAVYAVISTDPVYLPIAQEKGFFKKNGFDINLAHIPTNQAMQALVGGKIHFTTVGPQVVEASLSGADAVYIMGVINSFVLSLYAKPEIANVRALSGKTLGATNKGTPDFAARFILKQNGLVADSDVKFAYLKESPRWSPR